MDHQTCPSPSSRPPVPTPDCLLSAAQYRHFDTADPLPLPATRRRASEDERRVVSQARHVHAEELAFELAELELELSHTERRAAMLRRAREVLFAEIARAEYGIAPGDVVCWEGRRRGAGQRRAQPLHLRGIVLAAPMRDYVEIRRLNRRGQPMDQTLCVPVGQVTRL